MTELSARLRVSADSKSAKSVRQLCYVGGASGASVCFEWLIARACRPITFRRRGIAVTSVEPAFVCGWKGRIAAIAVASLFVACGGGGGGSRPEAPASVSPTATTIVTSAGGVVSVGDQAIASFAPGTFGSDAQVSVSVGPAADSNALTNDVTVTLDSTKLRVTRDAGLSVFFYPSPTAAGGANRRHALALLPSLDTSGLVAIATVGTSKLFSNITYDETTGRYTATFRYALWVIPAVGQATSQVISVNIHRANFDNSTGLYNWPSDRSPGEANLVKSQVKADERIPLVLVHGIEIDPIGGGTCGRNDQYVETWKSFAERFWADPELHGKYSLYTFRYPTNIGIRQNGVELGKAIRDAFGETPTPVVMLSHSMGGLVTRAADLFGGASGHIQGAITLDTPHRGVKNFVETFAALFEMSCNGNALHDGARDLAGDGVDPDNPEACSIASFLCGLNGVNENVKHLEKYVAYSGNFDLPSVEIGMSPSDLRSRYAAVIAEHPLYFWPRLFSSAGNDGVVPVSSQRFQSLSGSTWSDSPNVFKKLQPTYENTDHSQIRKSDQVFSRFVGGGEVGIRQDLLQFHKEVLAVVPNVPTATPPNGSFAGNTDINVIAGNAQRVYCTLRSTLDGSPPAEPPEPTEASNDPCGLSSPNYYISGNSGNFVLIAPASGVKRLKVRFRAWNNGQFSATTDSYEYQVGPSSAVVPNVPTANPPNGSFAGNTDINVIAGNAQRIYCTLSTTLDDSPPAEPPEPTESSNEPCGLTAPPNYISGTSGSFVLIAPASGVKRVKVRFRAWNNGQFSATTDTYEYQVSPLSAVVPNVPTANPASGSFAGNTSISVIAGNAQRIYCTLRSSLDVNVAPVEPPEPSETVNDPCGLSSPNFISGTSGSFVLIAPANGIKRVKVRFRAWNNGQFSATTNSYEYEVGGAPVGVVPNVPTATPPNSSFIGNTNISVIAGNAQRIYCTLRNTLDGSAPADPPEPTELSNDPCGIGSPNHIEGSGGSFVLVAPTAGSKRIKVRFRAWNNGQYSATTDIYEYQVGAPPVSVVPGVPSPTPSSGNFATGTNIAVVASNAERIYCTLRTTLDGSVPAEPPEPSEVSNDPCGLVSPNYISGSAGNFVLLAAPGALKRIKVRFRAWNAVSYSAATGSFEYQVAALTAAATITGMGAIGGSLYSSANAVSADGNTVVGMSLTASGSEAVRWTIAGGIVSIGELPGGLYGATAYGVSADGKTIVGGSQSERSGFYVEAFRWTEAGGMQALGGLGAWTSSWATGVSADGTTVIGVSFGDGKPSNPFRWTSTSGMQGLAAELSPVPISANGVSADGSTVVGSEHSNTFQGTPYRWTASTGMQFLESLDGLGGAANAVSADGRTVVGTVFGPEAMAARWIDGAVLGLGYLGTVSVISEGLGVSADGNVAVGYARLISGAGPPTTAFVWTPARGMRSLENLLRNEYGLDLANRQLDGATGVSNDGRTIVGNGFNPSGFPEGWVVKLNVPPQ
ncbi:MAG: hypothetical protein WA210_20890 [Burkholderiaceae bacterium]